MKIFNWMQSKLNGKQATNKETGIKQHNLHVSQPQPQKEEFSDWPHGLLAIGTFGNNDIKEETSKEEDPSCEEDQLDFTPEEVGKLQKELTKLLSRKPVGSESQITTEIANLPLDKFLNCPSSLEVKRTICQDLALDEKETQLGHSGSVLLSNRGKDVCMDHKNLNHKRSLSFLLKKMFVCSSGFAPSPSLRDQMPESRMDKLLKAILQKKIYPQSSGRMSTTKKYLENRLSSTTSMEDQIEEKRMSDCKWVKTDSEYIVLEI